MNRNCATSPGILLDLSLTQEVPDEGSRTRIAKTARWLRNRVQTGSGPQQRALSVCIAGDDSVAPIGALRDKVRNELCAHFVIVHGAKPSFDRCAPRCPVVARHRGATARWFALLAYSRRMNGKDEWGRGRFIHLDDNLPNKLAPTVRVRASKRAKRARSCCRSSRSWVLSCS